MIDPSKGTAPGLVTFFESGNTLLISLTPRETPFGVSGNAIVSITIFFHLAWNRLSPDIRVFLP